MGRWEKDDTVGKTERGFVLLKACKIQSDVQMQSKSLKLEFNTQQRTDKVGLRNTTIISQEVCFRGK